MMSSMGDGIRTIEINADTYCKTVDLEEDRGKMSKWKYDGIEKWQENKHITVGSNSF